MQAPAISTGTISGGAIWTGRILSGLAIVFLVFDGGIKLVPLDIVITTSQQLGIPTDLARTLGVLTLACTALYAFPRTSVLGAIYTHLRVGSPLFTHTLFGVYLALLIWGGLYLRDERVRALIPFQRT
ncbi:hypothetical protein ASC80_03160 [Afipia sp. Root123D2]|nr:hypothetical protein ASC80_03160 [Afipia sp. Root123D2]